MQTQTASADRGLLTAQYVRSIVAGKGDLSSAIAFASGRGPAWDRTTQVLKASIAAHGAAEADDLRRVLGADVRSAYRPLSIIGRLVGMRRIGFDTRMIGTTSGSTGSWVGRGNAVPVSKLNLSDAGTLDPLKVSGICAIDQELARSSDPNANAIISRDLSAALAYAEDKAFIDYQSAGSSGVQPAAVCYGSPTTVIGGTTVAAMDTGLKALVDALVDGGSDLTYCAWVMSAKVGRLLASMRDGSLAYPNINLRGVGSLMGMPAICSGAAVVTGSPQDNYLALIDTSQIWLAEDDAIDIQVARVGSFQASDAPTNSSSTPTATTQVSLFQSHTMALRATRMVSWARTASTACAVLRGITI